LNSWLLGFLASRRLLVPWGGTGHNSHYFGHRVPLRRRECDAAAEAHDVNAIC
jgi:hypothetical protein